MTRRVLVTRLDGAGDVLLAGPAVRAVAATGSDRRDPTPRSRCCAGPRAPPPARLLPGVARRAGVGQPVGRQPRAADRPRRARPVRRRPSRRTRVRRGRDPHVVPPVAPAHRAAAAAGRGRPDHRARRSTTRAPCSTCACGPATGPATTCPKTCPSPSGRWRSPPPPGYRLPGDDPGGARGAAAPAARRPARPAATAAPTSSLHPGAAVTARRWPAEHHRRAAGLLAGDGLAVVVTGGPDERALTAEVAAGAPGALDLGGRTGLPELSAVLAGADAVVVGNTGAAHLAAAVGTPVVSLFAPVVPAVRWRPYRVRQVLLGDQDAAVPRHPGPRLPGSRTPLPHRGRARGRARRRAAAARRAPRPRPARAARPLP